MGKLILPKSHELILDPLIEKPTIAVNDTYLEVRLNHSEEELRKAHNLWQSYVGSTHPGNNRVQKSVDSLDNFLKWYKCEEFVYPVAIAYLGNEPMAILVGDITTTKSAVISDKIPDKGISFFYGFGIDKHFSHNYQDPKLLTEMVRTTSKLYDAISSCEVDNHLCKVIEIQKNGFERKAIIGGLGWGVLLSHEKYKAPPVQDGINASKYSNHLMLATDMCPDQFALQELLIYAFLHYSRWERPLNEFRKVYSQIHGSIPTSYFTKDQLKNGELLPWMHQQSGPGK